MSRSRRQNVWGGYGPAHRRRAVGCALAALTAGALVAGTHPAVAAATWSANLFVGNEASFDGGIAGWSAGTPTTRVGHTSLTRQSGSGALFVTNTGAGANLIKAVSGANSATWTTATPGNRYRGRAWVRAATKSRAASITIAFLDRSGAVLDQATGSSVFDSPSNWQQLSDAVAIAPTNAAFAVVQVTFAGVAAFETHYVDSASFATAHGGAPAVIGPLHTSGNKIIDANGNQVIFRGFTRAGLEGGSGGDAPTADDISHAKAWGANYLRLPLGEQLWLPSSCDYDPTYVATVDDAVNLITGMGMVAVLELSYLEATPCGPAHQWPMADYPNSLTFWTDVASRYENNPLVAFDLFNEPFAMSDGTWLNGGSVTWKGTTYQAVGMQQLYDTVRATGATNLVFVSGNSWANLWPKTAPIAGTNIVYAVHTYTCPAAPPPNCSNTAPYDPSQFLRWWVAPSQLYPVMVTEFGWPDVTNGTYMRNVIQYASAHGWGWSAFTWGDHTWGSFSLLASAGAGANYEPDPAGMPVLAAFPGT